MVYTIDLTKQEAKLFCQENDCLYKDIQAVIVAFLRKDLESPHYRVIGGGEKFDIDNFLISKSPAELLTLRSNAYNNKTKLYEEIKEKTPSQTKL